MKTKNIFVFNKNKCVGCSACVVACINENGMQAHEQWRNITSFNSSHNPELPLFHLSMACNHCDDSPCKNNCPAIAYSKDGKTGAVIHDDNKCIGCKYCTWTCPFDAPKFYSSEGVVHKCTFCYERIQEGLKPACANLCPTGALDFENTIFDRKESDKSAPVKVDIGSKIKIIDLRNSKPEVDLSLFENQTIKTGKPENHKITAVKEWPLLLFTFIMAILVSVISANVIGENDSVAKAVFILTGVLASVFSLLHLGKKIRSWRSILNFYNSWLSREIIFYSIFMVLVFVDFYIFNVNEIIIRIIGVMLLISIDMLYTKAMWKWPVNVHSGQTLLIAAALFALLTNNPVLISIAIGIRLFIYIIIQIKLQKSYMLLIIIRNITLIAGITSYFFYDYFTGIGVLLFGDFIDRIDFYNHLRVPVISDEIKYSEKSSN